MNDKPLPTLNELDDWQLVNSDQDIRGCPLMSRAGEQLGIVRRMLVDCEHSRVAALVLDNGRAVPIEDVEICDGRVFIEEVREMPTGMTVPPTGGYVEVVPVVEEELVVGKRSVERGRIQVRSRIVEAPVHEQVMLRDEHVDVERRKVDVIANDADRLFQERTIEMTETDEEAVVAKNTRVVEEVVVRKGVEEHVEQIDDTVRRTEVDVERAAGDEHARLAAEGSRDRLS